MTGHADRPSGPAGYRRPSIDEGEIRVRVYLPATTTVLRTLVDEGRLSGPTRGFAVTPQLREFYALTDADVDTEELEYAALLNAARSSLRLLDVDPGAARRRVVVAADVPDAEVSPSADPDAERGEVQISGDIGIRDVASAHIDGSDAEEDVRAAVGVVLEADLGSDDAQFVVDQAEGHELAWYATQEIGPVLELL
jgi:hypothetical protein